MFYGLSPPSRFPRKNFLFYLGSEMRTSHISHLTHHFHALQCISCQKCPLLHTHARTHASCLVHNIVIDVSAMIFSLFFFVVHPPSHSTALFCREAYGIK